jgi:D-sedoheptulose 7-phosphate isomerase
MTDANQPILDSIRASAEAIHSLADQAPLVRAICDVITAALLRGNKVLTAGHGGSAAEALHLSEELVGRFDADRRPLPAISLVADPTLMTCIANDFGFAQVFPRQVEALGQAGDVLVIFSTSGNGDGLRLAVEMAKRKGVVTVSILGKTGGTLATISDHALVVRSSVTARVQEAHTLVLHLMLEAVERAIR